MRPGTSRSGTSPASTLMPREKTRSPQGLTRNLGEPSVPAPGPPAIDHRVEGALPRSHASAPAARKNANSAAAAAPAVFLTPSRGGATDGEAVDAHRRLADAHGHALPVLAAGADAV